MPVGAIAGAVGSIASGIIGSNAASQAANQLQAGYNTASGKEQALDQQAISQQQQATQAETAGFSPYTALGTQSTNSLANLLGTGGQLTQGYGSFTAPTAAQAAQQPGYQFQLQQGLNALQNSAAASGGLLSTGTAKNLENYAQGVASTNYNNVYNQALQTYGANQNTFYQNQNNLYNRLSQTSGQGLGAQNATAGFQQQGASALNNLYYNQGNQLGQNAIGSAQALASGTVGSANALMGGIQGATGAVGAGLGTNSLANLFGAQNAGAGSPGTGLSYLSQMGDLEGLA